MCPGDPLGTVQEIEIWPCEQLVYAQPGIRPGKWDAHTFLGFWDTNGSPNLSQKTRPYNNQQKEVNFQNCGLCCPLVHRVKLKESEKKDKYFDLTRELKKSWNMKVTVIPIVIGSLCVVTKGLVQGLQDLEISGRWEIIQTIAILRSARIVRKVLET